MCAVKRLQDICDLRKYLVDPQEVRTERYVALEHLEPGRIQIGRWQDNAAIRSSKYRFEANDILFGKLRPYLRKVAIAEWPGICSTELLVLTARRDFCDPHYLAFLLLSRRFTAYAIQHTVGVNHPRVAWSSLENFEFLLPSAEEQLLIVSTLQALQNSMQIQRRIVDAIREAKTVTTAHLFANGVRGERRASTPFGLLPTSWTVQSLSTVAEIQTGVTKGRDLSGNDTIDVPYLRVANVQDGRLDLRDVKSITIKTGELDRYRLRDGDVLLTEGGDFDKLGRGFVWRGELDVCVHQNHIFAVRADRHVLEPEFLGYLIQSPHSKRFFLSVAHKTTSLACINSTKLKRLPVLIPSIAEQREICGALRTIDSSLLFAERRLEVLEELFDATLNMLAGARTSNTIRLTSDVR